MHSLYKTELSMSRVGDRDEIHFLKIASILAVSLPPSSSKAQTQGRLST
uniref:Uncharacterized protein n=1 Tax=Arundo donax TaxID=35708 RepID=A0A0A9F0J2_ARUDO